MTIIIAGGTGFLGHVLEAYFSKKKYTVKILTRHPKKINHIYWNGKDLGTWTQELDKADVLINLAGKSVDCRYTQKNKKLIYDSRVDSTHALGLAINLCEHPPKVWLNSSTATIYKHSLDKEMTEEHGEIGTDFSMTIAQSWEHAFNSIRNPKTRKICLRTAIVLGKKGGALVPLKRITKFGLGGKQGSGLQKVSWIHEEDFARAIEFLILSKLDGAFNLSVPKPTSNKTFTKALRKTLNVPFGISQPKWLVEIGAKLINTEPELILKSRYAVPERLSKAGFNFKYTTITIALKNLFK